MKRKFYEHSQKEIKIKENYLLLFVVLFGVIVPKQNKELLKSADYVKGRDGNIRWMINLNKENVDVISEADYYIDHGYPYQQKKYFVDTESKEDKFKQLNLFSISAK